VKGVIVYALARLRAAPRRGLFAAGGIVTAAAMVGAAVTVAAALGSGFDRAAARAHLPDVIATFGNAPADAVLTTARALPNVRAVAVRFEANNIELRAPEHDTFDATLVGVRPRLEASTAKAPTPGRKTRSPSAPVGPHGYAVVSGHDVRARSDVVVERGLARAWHLHVGETVIVAGGLPLRVAGVAVEPDTVAFPLAARPRVYVSYDVARAAGGASPGEANQLLLWAADPARLDATLAQARAASFGLTSLEFLTRSGIRVEIAQAAGIVIALLVAFSAVALAAAGAILAASSASEVQRRLEAIGVLRALGASPRAIVLGHVVEAALVATPAAALGLVVGWLAVRGPTNDLLVSISELGPGRSLVWLLALALAAIVGVVAVAAAFPAARAARRRPVDALRGADIVATPTRLPLPAGARGLGMRLALARPLRSATTVAVLAVSAAFALLLLAIASLLGRLQSEPHAIGRSYQLTIDAPAAKASAVRRLPGVVAATPRYETPASDSFDLGESFDVVAFGANHADYEAPPLAAGRRLRARGEAEVGLGLAQALDLHPGSTLAAQLPSGREARFHVVGIVRALTQQGRIAYVDPRALLAAEPGAQSTLAVKTAPGAASRVEREAAGIGLFASSSGGVAGDAVQGWAARNSGFVSILVALLRTVAVLDALVCAYAFAQVLALTAVERRQAIAVVRAVGASAAQVRRLFTASAVTIAALAAPLAVVLERNVLGPFVAGLAAPYADLSLAAGAPTILVVVAVLVATSLVVGAVVARRASATPVTAALADL
jgi:ABC-type lipoprotein release transport system permease subunit